MKTPIKHRFILLSVLFVMIISSGVLIAQFGTGGKMFATSAQPSTQNSAYVASAYDTVGNTIIVAENASLLGYVKGTQIWIATALNVARMGTYGVLAIGNSLKRAINVTMIIAPTLYLKGIYTVGDSMAYLGIKSVAANSVASVGFIDFLGRNIPNK